MSRVKKLAGGDAFRRSPDARCGGQGEELQNIGLVCLSSGAGGCTGL